MQRLQYYIILNSDDMESVIFKCVFARADVLNVVFREQMLQVLLRITEAVMKRPQGDQRKDAFAQSLASVLFRVSQEPITLLQTVVY